MLKENFGKLVISEEEREFLIELEEKLPGEKHINNWDYRIKNNKIVKLDLSNKSLGIIPESIDNLSSLRRLNLNFNNLEFLPESICNIQSLMELYLLENKLISIPEQFGLLRNLKTLDLGFNQLRELPESIGRLRRLRHLLLTCNYLEKIPQSIGTFKQIQILDLSGNNITFFPLSKSDKAVEALDLSDTPLFNQNFNYQDILLITRLKRNRIMIHNSYETQVIFLDNWIETIEKKMEKKQEREGIWKEKLSVILGSYNLYDYDEEIIDAVKYRFCINRHYIRHGNDIEIGKSKFGGNPDVPENFEWPYWEGRPLSFLMQLNLEDFNIFTQNPFPVRRGFLYFFYDFEQGAGNNDFPNNREEWRVIYQEEKKSDLVRKPNPSIDRKYTYPTCLISLYPDIHLPAYPWHIFPDYSLKKIKEIEIDYSEFYRGTFDCDIQRFISENNLNHFGRHSIGSILSTHSLFGYPDQIQELGIMRGWRQLLQLGTDNIMRWKWGGGGYIHYMIKEEDFRKNNYNNIWLRIDCF